MIRSQNHSSYPRVADSPLDQQLRTVLKAAEHGKATADEVREIEDEVMNIAVAEQSRAFIDIVTDGMVRWAGPHSHLARHLEGLETRGLRRWFDTNFYDRQVAVVGQLSRPVPFLVHDFNVADDVAQTPVKIVLPGPVSFARMAHDEVYGSIEKLAEAVAAVMALEVTDLVAAGAVCFQLDEPLLCRHPEDLDLVATTAGKLFEAAGGEATTILSTYFGDLAGVADALDRLPGTHLGLDLVAGPANAGLLAQMPRGKGLALGVFDARTTRQEDAADVAAALEPYKDSLIPRDVIVGPNAGLELLPRDQAFDKLLHARYLVEKLSQEWTWPC
jgi:5-methyltetrahydropteroyltriglutamate--homocysteine methyltransferase